MSTPTSPTARPPQIRTSFDSSANNVAEDGDATETKSMANSPTKRVSMEAAETQRPNSSEGDALARPLRSALKRSSTQATAISDAAGVRSTLKTAKSVVGFDAGAMADDENRNAAAARFRKVRTGSLSGMGALSTLKSRATFRITTEDSEYPTRQQMIRYLAVQYWSRWSLMFSPLFIALWIAVLLLLIVGSHTEDSYFIREAISQHIVNITGDLSRGTPPDRTYSEALSAEDSGVRCRCACALEETEALCADEDEGRSIQYRAQLPLRKLATLRNRAEYQASASSGGDAMGWDDLLTISDVWFWLQHGFLPDLWKESSMGDPISFEHILDSDSEDIDSNTSRGILRSWNQVIGGIRMRQFRLEESACTMNSRITARYSKTCHTGDYAQDPFGPGLQSWTEGFMPHSTVTGAYDAYFDLAYGIETAVEKAQYVLDSFNWLDSSTNQLLVQAAFVNAQASPPMFGVLEIIFNFERSGGLTKEIRVQSLPATAASSTLEFVLLVVWLSLVGLELLRSGYKAIKYCQAPSDKKPSLTDIWSLSDWVTLLFSIVLVINYFLLLAEMDFAAQEAANLPSAPVSADATTTALQTYHEAWDKVLDEILDLNEWGVWNRVVMFFYTLMLTFQFLQVFRGQPKLAELALVLINSGEDLVHFVVVFLVLFLNFAFGGYMIYGVYLEEWSTGTRSINTSLQVLFGMVDLSRMHDVAPKSTIIWFCSFVACLTFVMLNLLLAIACDNFSYVKAKGGTKCGVIAQAKYTAKEQHRRGWIKGLFCWFRSDPEKPSHWAMLEELLYRCGFDDQERRQFEGNVIKAQYIRHAAEKAAFAAENDSADDKLQARQLPVDVDMREMGCDEDYLQALCSDAKQFVEDEYDFDERREGQLREIVAVCYDVMTEMRLRLAQCQSYTGQEMSGLAQRLEALEIVVHRSLEELVRIADGANISTKGEPATSAKSRAFSDTAVSRLRSLSAADKSRGMMTGTLKSVLGALKEEDNSPAPHEEGDDGDNQAGAVGRGGGGGGGVHSSNHNSTSQPGSKGGVLTSALGLPVKVFSAKTPKVHPAGHRAGASITAWHRADQNLGVSGKRVDKSARQEWARK